MKGARMRGVNLGGWFSQVDCIAEKDPEGFGGFGEHVERFLGPDDLFRIAGWGLDHVRLPVDWFNICSNDAEVRPDEAALALLDRAVKLAGEAGLRVILDLHKCPGHDFHAGLSGEQPFFADPGLRRAALKVWSLLAERYGQVPGIVLELLNEPVATDAAIWNTVKDELHAHVRRLAPRATILVGSNRWNSAGEFDRLTPVDDDNVLYSFHFYNPMLFTHQRAPWLPGETYGQHVSYPGRPVVPGATSQYQPDPGYWDAGRMEAEIEPVLRFRDRYKVTVACNEFGVYVGGANRLSQLNWIRDFLGVLERHDLGFSYWNYKNLDFGLVSQGERLHAGLPQYRNDPDNLDRELANLLCSH